MASRKNKSRRRHAELLFGLFTLSQVYASPGSRGLSRSESEFPYGAAIPMMPMIYNFYPFGVDISHPRGMMPMSWRYTGGGSGPRGGINLGLGRRQNSNEEGYCQQGSHACRAVSAIGCCTNNTYCMVNTSGDGQCCPLGSRCIGDPCETTATYCEPTVTVTQTPTGTASTGTPVITVVPTTACCNRACALTAHLCDQNLGGSCCRNDMICISGNLCRPTPNPGSPFQTTSTTTSTTSLNPCRTGSIACASAVGGGCCPVEMVCTVSNGVGGCALPTGGSVSSTGIGGSLSRTTSGSPIETGDNNNGNNTTSGSGDGNGGLSTGAKAGVGVGAAAGALAIAAVIAILVIRKKKAAGAATGEAAVSGAPAPAAMGMGGGQVPFPSEMQGTQVYPGTGQYAYGGAAAGGYAYGGQQVASPYYAPQQHSQTELPAGDAGTYYPPQGYYSAQTPKPNEQVPGVQDQYGGYPAGGQGVAWNGGGAQAQYMAYSQQNQPR